MGELSIQDFWLVDSGPECHDKPWAIPGLPMSLYNAWPPEAQVNIPRGRPFDFSVELWLDRRTSGKLSDMPVCDGLHFVVSPKLHVVLEPFFGDSVRSREIEIRSNIKGDVVYHILEIQQGAEAADANRGAAMFYVPSKYATKGIEFVDAYGIYFDTSTWTGADIFRMGPYGNKMIVTPRVAEAVSAADLVSVSVVRLDLYGIENWNRYLETGKPPYQF